MAVQLDRQALAETNLRTVLRQRSNSVCALTSLSGARGELGQLAEAERLAHRAIQIDDSYARPTVPLAGSCSTGRGMRRRAQVMAGRTRSNPTMGG